MKLLDLPPEILDSIITSSAPKGLESFALSCKTIYLRSTAQIKQHNALKKRWSLTTNASPARRGDTLAILCEIAREPIIAEYIRFLSLWDRRSADEISDGPNLYDFRNDNRAMKNIKEFLYRAPYFARAHADANEWWEAIIREDQAEDDETIDNLFATVVLLSLLPNLETLQLPDRWHEVRGTEAAGDLVSSVESLITMATAGKSESNPLANLERMFPFVEEGYDVRVGLQCLQPFMVLPNMHYLYAVSCVAVSGDWQGIPFLWPNPSLRSPLTRVEFACCCMDASGLSVLLANTPALTVFKLSHQSKWDGLEFDWNPGEILEALAHHAGERLTEIAITIDELHGEIINGLSSFMRFSKLQTLEVDVESFCGPPVESGQRCGQNGSIPPGAKPWTHVDIPCMGDMLPTSICELHVNTDFPRPSVQALLALFKNIKDRRQDKLLQLEKAVIRQYRSSSVLEIANGFGLILEVFDKDAVRPRPRSMMPQWKREFDDLVGGIVMADSGTEE